MKLLYVLILILLITNIQAEEYVVTSIERCVGDINIKVQGEYTAYYLVGCKLQDKYWQCPCDLDAIKIDVDEKTELPFDFTIFYYVEDIRGMSDIEKSNAERKVVLSSFVLKESEVPDEVRTPINTNIIMAIIIFVVFAAVAGLFFIGKHFYRKIMKDDENE